MTMSIKSIIDTDKRKGDTDMSEKEMELRLLDNVPSYKLGYVIAYLQGITADDAKKAGLSVISKKYPMSANGKSLLSNQERGFIKVVADEQSHKILGAQMMCARATDMISEFSTAIVNELTLEQMGAVVRPHPTFSEGITEAVRE